MCGGLFFNNADERLLAAARSDNEELLLDVLEHPDSFDINFKDGCVHSPGALRVGQLFHTA